MKKRKQNKKNTSKNNKGFTLIEIIAVVVIMGILVVVSGISVTKYIENSKKTTYDSYKKDLKGAAKNYYIDCMTNNEEGCEVPIPAYGISEKLTYNILEKNGYTEKLKDPEGDGYCDKSYVIVNNNSQDGVDLEYQVCLYCKNYKSEENGCKEIGDSDDATPPTCGETKGESTEWSKENKVVVVKCTDSDIGCKKIEFSKSIGKDGEVITEDIIVIEDNAGNKTSCPVKAYVDRKAPTCKIKVDGESFNGWYKAGVTATITDVEDEGSGVALTGIGTSLINRNYNGQTSYQVTGGIVTVFGYVKDKVGNEGYCSKEIKVDNTVPSGVIYMGYEVYPKENTIKSGNTFIISNISKYGQIEGVILHFNDTVSSVIRPIIKNENGTQISNNSFISFGEDYGIIRVTPGIYNQLQVNINNSTYAKKISKIEVIKKENETSVWTNKDVTVYVEGKDTITGVDSYSFDDGINYIKNANNSYTQNTSGYIYIKDKVGNISPRYSFVINKIDKIAPSAPIVSLVDGRWNERSNGTWYNHDIYVSGSTNSSNPNPSSTDTGGSGIEKYQISTDNSNWIDWSYNSSSGYYMIYNTGTTYRYVRAIDIAGNISEVTTKTIQVDKVIPNCGSIKVSGTSGWNGWYKSNVTISNTNGSDEHSGHASTTIDKTSINYNTDGTTVTLTTKDNAGNTCTTSQIIKVDTTTPTLVYKSACELKNDWTVCNKFETEDTYAQLLYIDRAHCAEPKLSNQTSKINYCVTGYSALERLQYYIENGKNKEGENKATRTLVYSGDAKNTSGILEMGTTFASANNIQYAFRGCDQAGNCSKVYTFKYICTNGTNYTCSASKVE